MPTEAELIRQSRFIFKGTIQKLKAATMVAVPVTDDVAIVKVDEVFEAPQGLGDQTNREITIQLTQPKKVEEGQQAVFYTNGWLYGESLAVREVGRRPVTLTASARVPKRIARMALSRADQELREHIADADVVVAGKVAYIRPAETSEYEQPRQQPPSEHDPEWWEAVVQVESVEKGDLEHDTFVLYFPASLDVMWAGVPKFHAGQEGVWILKRGQIDEMSSDACAVLDASDFHEKDQLDRIQSFVVA